MKIETALCCFTHVQPAHHRQTYTYAAGAPLAANALVVFLKTESKKKTTIWDEIT